MTASDPPRQLTSGQIIGDRYRILGALGKGGQGETYLAEDTHLPGNSRRAIKHLQSARKDEDTLSLARKMFEREAEVLEQIGQNPRIPQLFDYFQVDCQFYLVQELVEGQTLGEQIRSGKRWREADVIHLLKEVLSTLQFVHSNGVLHRDLKPDNLMIRPDGTIALIDFGAVKLCVARAQAAGIKQNSTIAIGTLGYMPVEQALGNPVEASDLYALGVIAIQALTGIHPRDLSKDENGELVWQEHTSISKSLSDFLNTLVCQHHTERFPSASEALRHLNRLHVHNASLPAFSNSDETVTVIRPPKILQEEPIEAEISQEAVVIPSSQSIFNSRFRKGQVLGIAASALAGAVIVGGGMMLLQRRDSPASTVQTVLGQMQLAIEDRRFEDCVSMAEAMLSLEELVSASGSTQAEMEGLLSVCRVQLDHSSAPGSIPAETEVALNPANIADVSVNYRRLEQLLEGQQWIQADLETDRVILMAAEQQQQETLDLAAIQSLACSDLETVDRLWTQHSQGRFGFSIQRPIWEQASEGDRFQNFTEAVGWRRNGRYLYYEQLADDPERMPLGHMPFAAVVRGYKFGHFNGNEHNNAWWLYRSEAHFEALGNRLVACGIEPMR